MRNIFSLFSTPIQLAHAFWEKLLSRGDIVIDATMGNGKDTLALAQILRTQGGGEIWSLDIQEKALENTLELLKEHVPDFIPQITLSQSSHEEFPKELPGSSVKLIVYNLGYLPGADKALTTKTETTLISIRKALNLLTLGGALSITCYPGHEEGRREYEAIHTFLQGLEPKEYSVTEHTFTNRHLSPILTLVQKGKL